MSSLRDAKALLPHHKAQQDAEPRSTDMAHDLLFGKGGGRARFAFGFLVLASGDLVF
jgi:hypothetical protein